MKEDLNVEAEEFEKPRDMQKRKKKNKGNDNSDENSQIFKMEIGVNPIEGLIYTIIIAILVGAFFELEEYHYEVALIIVIIVLIFIITYQYKKIVLYERLMKTKNIKEINNIKFII